MNNSFVEAPDGKPRLVRHEHVGLGLAVDMEKPDGSRTLLVPAIRRRRHARLRGLLAAYEELIRKAKTNKLTPDDFAGVTVTLTNPGTIGTEQSVPRLMPGQGVIVGVGSLDYPTGFAGADPRTIADLGVSKVITITSTYDHRIIQGAESGLFLKQVARAAAGRRRLLRGGVPLDRRALRGGAVASRRQPGRPRAPPWSRSRCRSRRSSTCTGCAATSSPTSIRCRRSSRRCTPSSIPPPTASPSGTSTASSSPAGRRHLRLGRRHPPMPLGDILHVLRDAYCRTVGIEYMHIQEPEEKRWIQEQVEGAPDEAARRGAAPHPRPAQRGRGAREVPRDQVPRPEALRPRGRRVAHPDARRDPRPRRPTRGSTPPCSAWPIVAGSTCSSTSWASPTSSSSGSSRATSTPTRSRVRAT